MAKDENCSIMWAVSPFGTINVFKSWKLQTRQNMFKDICCRIVVWRKGSRFWKYLQKNPKNILAKFSVYEQHSRKTNPYECWEQVRSRPVTASEQLHLNQHHLWITFSQKVTENLWQRFINQIKLHIYSQTCAKDHLCLAIPLSIATTIFIFQLHIFCISEPVI